MYYLKNARGWKMSHSELYVLLELKPGSHLPAEGIPVRQIQGIDVWVEPKTTSALKHRVMARCPGCKAVLSAGRLHQHKC